MENATLSRPPGMAWDLTLETTDTIVTRLAGAGIETDTDALRSAARRTGSPSGIADEWISQVEMPEAGEIPPEGDRPGATIEAMLTASAFELWKRWLPDLDCADILAEDFDRNYEPLDILMFGHPAAAREALARAHRIADAVAPPGYPPDRELFEEIWSRTYHDLALWLRCLPQVLAHRELFEEAIGLCERLASIFDARAFLAERALLLAQCGRLDEARHQVGINIRAWPRDPIVLRKSCETLWALGRSEEALLLYDEVLEMMSPAGETGGAAPARALPT